MKTSELNTTHALIIGAVTLVAIFVVHTAGVVVSSIPSYVYLAGLMVVALWLLLKFGGLRLDRPAATKQGTALSWLAVVAVAAVMLLIVAPALPAVENVFREDSEKHQTVYVTGILAFNQYVIGQSRAGFTGVVVDWEDQRAAVAQFFPMCGFWQLESEPVTVNARLKRTDGAEDYRSTALLGTFCGLGQKTEDFKLTFPEVIPGNYTVDVSATIKDRSGDVKIIGYALVGDFHIHHREGGQ